MDSTKILEIIHQSEQNATTNSIKRYVNFVLACHNKNQQDKPTYTEKHHILPKSIFQEYKNFKLNPWNLAILTARQHIIAHIMLSKIYPKTAYAIKRMLRYNNIEISNTLFDFIRSVLAKENSKRVSGTVWINKNKRHKMIKKEKLPEYIKRGWSIGRTDNKSKGLVHAYNPETKEGIMCNPNELPEGWVFGNIGLTGKVHAYNPTSKECGMFEPEKVPEGWVQGNINGKGKYYIHKKTKQKRLFSEEPDPKEWKRFRNTAKYYHNPKNPKECRRIDDNEEVPEGWVRGNTSQLGISRNKSKLWYTDPKTGISTMALEGEQPEGWVRGRKKAQ